MKVEPRHTFSINLPTSLYQKVVDKAGKGRVSVFIREVLEKELGEEQLKQQLILAHQRTAKNQKLKKELAVWDETVDDYIDKDNGKN
jgi:hypothetical protein